MRRLKKLSGSRGETIIETMVAMLIITLAILVLAGAILTAARLNARVGDGSAVYADTTADSKTNVTVKVEHSTGSSNSYSSQGYITEDGYYYYGVD